MPELRYYRMGPLHLASELEIPELPEDRPGSGTEVAVRLGTVPNHLAAPLLATPIHEATMDEYLLRVTGTGTFYAAHGDTVIIQPEEGTSALDLRTYLLGIVFAVLCHQRGLLPLHASAVRTPNGAVAFLGDSGAGKSSLAAFLGHRGFGVVADDICLIDPMAPLSTRVIPVAPWLKLWRDTLGLLGEAPEQLLRTFSSDDKYRLNLDGTPDPLPLAGVILLQRTEDADVAVRFEQLSAVQAVQALMRFTFRAYLMHGTGQTPAHFQRCGKALEGAAAFVLTRPWGFDRMDAVLDALEARFRTSEPPANAMPR